MRKQLTLSVIAWLVIFNAPAFGQRTNSREYQNSDDSERIDMPIHKKKKRMHYHAEIGFEGGGGEGCFLNSSSHDFYYSWSAGIPVFIPLVGRLHLQTGLYYANNGGMIFISDNQARYGLDYDEWHIQSINVPVILGLRFGRPRRYYYSSYIGIGPFVGYNFGGSYKELLTGRTGSLNDGPDGSSLITPYAYGLAFNLGLEWRCGLFYLVKCRWDAANIANEGTSYVTTFDYSITLGWLFGKRGKPHIPHRDHYIDEKL